MVTTDRGSSGKKRHAPMLPNRRYGYFRDKQIIFLVSHPADEISDDELKNFKIKINGYLENSGQGGTIEKLSQMFSFPNVSTKGSKERLAQLIKLEVSMQNGDNLADSRPEPFSTAFSLLVCDLVGTSDDPAKLLNLIKDLRNKVGGQNFETLKVEDVSPNWLMSVASQGAGTGGPGGLPTAFKGKEDEAPYKFDKFINSLEKKDLYNSGTDVDVAILDTAPCLHDLVLALAPQEGPENPLISSLLGPAGKLQLYPATYEELLRMGNTSLNRHNYKMTDHGLFAAGIVHSIVPDANIYLIEVLNQFGIGDLASLAGGMRKVVNEIYNPGTKRHLVVNCSWMLELPLSEGHTSAATDEGPEYDFEKAVLDFVSEARDQAYALKAICDRLYLLGAQVVAAAGNDWNKKKLKGEHADDQRANAPEARYPAAFVSAVGVGALPKDLELSPSGKHKASKYSNLGDKPAGDGIMTLGGEEGREKGVLGLYLSEKFPERAPTNANPHALKQIERKTDEDNHWAWWAGTSFATPILTGTIAAVLNSPANPGDTQSSIEKLYGKNIVLSAETDASEDVMEVDQG